MSNPLVSVIVTVYNGENFLREALDSVLGQSYKNLEIIIVDDGSTDGTSGISKTYQDKNYIYYVLQGNGGHAAALNKGISVATGDFLSFIDHDDLWEPEKLERQLKSFANNPTLDVVFAYQKNFAENAASKKLAYDKQPIPGYMPGSMLIRKSAFFKVGYFDTSIRKGYFMPWFDLMKLKALKTQLLPDLLYHRRVHGENISICADSKDYSDYFLAIRVMRRQRQNED